MFTSSQSSVDQPALLSQQHQLLARHRLGSLRQMVIEVSTDPAMLIFLIGELVGGCTERELRAGHLELSHRRSMNVFTVGGPDTEPVGDLAMAQPLHEHPTGDRG